MIGELSFTSMMFTVTCTVLCSEGDPPEKKKKSAANIKESSFIAETVNVFV